ncbi:hypothetical protein [Wenxinia marina]|uniref:Uncharacterized protein n=1 Tax=Wenxinia marina DSM 24838 TaxID=1123501 RepID=A0A0D0Q8E4_9RHOB|nr:hypothetical protein [Wenxinia marina]KIQ68662.1 hypothetical protein Wenmar_02933 [Wenxinia marina DSM 24838]GGL67740.1 hypothetical protein GCM10011392_22760 [Wenxinia marina]
MRINLAAAVAATLATAAAAGFFGTPTGGWGFDDPPPRPAQPRLP